MIPTVVLVSVLNAADIRHLVFGIMKYSSLITFLLLLLGACRSSNAKINFREKEKEILDQILGPGRYDARIRPSGVNGTGKSCCSAYIVHFYFSYFTMSLSLS